MMHVKFYAQFDGSLDDFTIIEADSVARIFVPNPDIADGKASRNMPDVVQVVDCARDNLLVMRIFYGPVFVMSQTGKTVEVIHLRDAPRRADQTPHAA